MDSKALQYIKKLGPLIGLILLFVIISVMNDSFLEFSNLRNLLRQVSINAIIAFGMTFRHLNRRYRLIRWFHPSPL